MAGTMISEALANVIKKKIITVSLLHLALAGPRGNVFIPGTAPSAAPHCKHTARLPISRQLGPATTRQGTKTVVPFFY